MYLIEAIKKQILKIYQCNDLFEVKFPQKYELDFDMEEYQFVAEKLIEYDFNLAMLRNTLVPERIEDEEFWHRVFYKIETIKKKMGLVNNFDLPPQKRGVYDKNIGDSTKKCVLNLPIGLYWLKNTDLSRLLYLLFR